MRRSFESWFVDQNRELIKGVSTIKDFKAIMLRRDDLGNYEVVSVDDQYIAYKAGCKRAKMMRSLMDHSDGQ